MTFTPSDAADTKTGGDLGLDSNSGSSVIIRLRDNSINVASDRGGEVRMSSAAQHLSKQRQQRQIVKHKKKVNSCRWIKGN